MNKIDSNLANRLLNLPIDLGEKVLLWLTYKGLKPVSEITVVRRGNLKSLVKRGIKHKYTYDFTSPKSERIKKWLKDAGLYFVPETKNGISWHVGKNPESVNLSARIIRKFDYENELQSGRLFGYPESSVKAYAHNRIAKKENQIPMLWLKDSYYSPYDFYRISVSSVVGDCLIAKSWADTIQNDIPKLAEWFEKQFERRAKIPG